MAGMEFVTRADLADAVIAESAKAGDGADGGGRIVALLDAACLPGLPERLEDWDAPSLAMFQGDAAEDLRDVAPYFVEMDAAVFRHFVNDQDVHWAMWRKRAGVLIATDLSLEELRKHFRRFLRVETAASVYFFRFWEPAAARDYFRALPRGDRRERWFLPRDGGRISAFLIPDVTADGLWIERGRAAKLDTQNQPPFTISPDEMGAIEEGRRQDDVTMMIALMAATFPDLTRADPPIDLERSVQKSVGRAWEFGIKQRDNAFQIAAWDAHTSGKFETIDPAGHLRALLESPIDEADKMRRLEERIAELEA